MSEFKEVRPHLLLIAIARACNHLAGNGPAIDGPGRVQVLKYLQAKSRYEAHQATKKALHASGGVAKVVPIMPLSARSGARPASKPIEKFMQPGPAPEKPDCPQLVRDFLNALGANGLTLGAISDEVTQIIIRHVDTFTVDDDGIRSPRLSSANYQIQRITTGQMRHNYHRPPWTAQRPNGTYGPVMMNKTDLDYLLEHGQPRPDEPVKQTIASQKQCEDWLAGMMENNAPKKKPRAEYESEAKSKFSISGRQFETAWKAAIARTGNADWSKPGARKKGD